MTPSLLAVERAIKCEVEHGYRRQLGHTLERYFADYPADPLCLADTVLGHVLRLMAEADAIAITD